MNNVNAAKNLTLWQPGKSANPHGRPKLPPELLAIKAMYPSELARLIAKYARMPKCDVFAACEIPNLPMVEASIASIFSKCFEKGDWLGLSFLLDRAIGKAPILIEETSNEDLQQLSDEELMRILAEKLPQYSQVKQIE